ERLARNESHGRRRQLRDVNVDWLRLGHTKTRSIQRRWRKHTVLLHSQISFFSRLRLRNDRKRARTCYRTRVVRVSDEHRLLRRKIPVQFNGEIIFVGGL